MLKKRNIIVLSCLSAILLSVTSFGSGMYKCTNPDGQLEFTDTPCAGAVKPKPVEDLAVEMRLSEENIQGKWDIMMVRDQTGIDIEFDADAWVFRKNQRIVVIEDRALKPDEFTIGEQSIDLDGAQIDVLELTDRGMSVKEGEVYLTLQKGTF